MDDLIQDRLNKISNLSDRKLLRSVLQDVFENVVSYNMDMYQRLEDRLYGEVADPMDNFAIYAGMDYAEDIDPISDFLHPMLPPEEEPAYDLKEMSEQIRRGEEVVIASIFMKCSNITMEKILDKGRIYKGFIKTDKNVYEAKAEARRCHKYLDEIERLYRIFQANEVAWSTVNCPYAYKFIDIVLKSGVRLAVGETITEITVDLGEFERYKELNVVPLWNIKPIAAEDKVFPMPAGDRMNYEHKIDISKFGRQNGYLVSLDNADFSYSKRQEGGEIIVSKNEKERNWNLLQIENIANAKRRNGNFETLTNKRDLGFVGRYSAIKSLVIRTTGELARRLASYEQSKTVVYQGVEIIDSTNKPLETFDCNSFIDNNIRIDAQKKIMLIKFYAARSEDFLVYDKVSFLVSEMQVLFPEYKCVGELV